MANEVWFPVEKDEDGYPKSRDWEGLHCDVVDDGQHIYKVRNIPFYLKNVAYNDSIKAKENLKGYMEFEGVVQRGGWSVYRLLLKRENLLAETLASLESMKIKSEVDGNLIALAVPPEQDFEALVDFIVGGKERGVWGAQDGFIFED